MSEKGRLYLISWPPATRNCPQIDSTLVALDGVWLHNAKPLHCKRRNHREHREGKTTYLSQREHPGDREPGITP